MNKDYSSDRRAVLTLDAGGTNLKFSAVRGYEPAIEPFSLPSKADRLDTCLEQLCAGFEEARRRLGAPPAAISFAFPGPADYPAGVIGDLPNLPAFRGGVPLGPILEERFKVPVFINNDGDLFAAGEARAGFLPEVNAALERAGSPKRYRNLFAVTLGTGFGGGIVRDGVLFGGDNSCAGEAWLLRNKLRPELNAEEGCCIRAVRRVYAELAGLPLDRAPEPKEIFAIGTGAATGDRAAALEAYRRLGETAGDAIAQALTLVDGLAVVGGGVSGAAPLFLPALVGAMNDVYNKPGGALRRLVPRAYNYEDPAQRAEFLKGDRRELPVPGSSRVVAYDPVQRTAAGLSRLGTSRAVAVGAYAFALEKLG